MPPASSTRASLATSTAPACSRRLVTVASAGVACSRSGSAPQLVGAPFAATRSLSPYGMPCRGPRSLPLEQLLVRAVRLAHRPLARERHHGAELRADRLEPPQRELRELDRAERARAQLGADLADAAEERLLGDHGCRLAGGRASKRPTGSSPFSSRDAARSRDAAARLRSSSLRTSSSSWASRCAPNWRRTASVSASATASGALAAAGLQRRCRGKLAYERARQDRRDGERLQETASRSRHGHLLGCGHHMPARRPRQRPARV